MIFGLVFYCVVGVWSHFWKLVRVYFAILLDAVVLFLLKFCSYYPLVL